VNDKSPFDVSQFVDPQLEKITSTITNYAESLVNDLGSTDCNSDSLERFLQEDSTDSSLASKIRKAIEDIKQDLNKIGINIEGDVKPYFDSKTFAAGVTTTFSVSFEQTGAGLIDIFESFFNETTKDSSQLGLDEGAPSDFDVLISKLYCLILLLSRSYVSSI